jgi:glutamate:GABA antiporter
LLSSTPLGVEGALQAFCQITERSGCFAQVRILFLEVADTRETVFQGPRIRFAQRALLSRTGVERSSQISRGNAANNFVRFCAQPCLDRLVAHALHCRDPAVMTDPASDDATLQRAEASVEVHSRALRRELGLADLVLTQILFIVGLPWVGVAAKLGSAHVAFWLLAIVFFYLPSALVVIHLNRAMPLEGGLYQWAKLGFNELLGFIVAWNLWLFAILNTSETGLQVTQYLEYILGPELRWLTASKWFTCIVSAAIILALVMVTIRGLSVGKIVHNAGGALMLLTFATIMLLPWLNRASGAIPEYHPLSTAMPPLTLFGLNLLGKMGFGALGGFEYVAIHAGECKNPVRSIGRSVAIAAPIIALMFILGTGSVLALVPMDRIDLIAPIPQVLSEGFRNLGSAASVAPLAILALLVIRLAQASVMFTGTTRLPMVTGWDGLLPAWFTRVHPSYGTPVNSVLFVGAVTLALGMIGLIGVGKQEAFQLLWNASGIFYALTYLVMFAVPLLGRATERSWWLTIAALSGFLMTLLFVVLSVLPIIQVENRLAFTAKISALIIITNLIGVALFVRTRARLSPTP